MDTSTYSQVEFFSEKRLIDFFADVIPMDNILQTKIGFGIQRDTLL